MPTAERSARGWCATGGNASLRSAAAATAAIPHGTRGSGPCGSSASPRIAGAPIPSQMVRPARANVAALQAARQSIGRARRARRLRLCSCRPSAAAVHEFARTCTAEARAASSARSQVDCAVAAGRRLRMSTAAPPVLGGCFARSQGSTTARWWPPLG
eukprot:scaffold9020_cov75-Phaeocystis_antarctica.AAC.3